MGCSILTSLFWKRIKRHQGMHIMHTCLEDKWGQVRSGVASLGITTPTTWNKHAKLIFKLQRLSACILLKEIESMMSLDCIQLPKTYIYKAHLDVREDVKYQEQLNLWSSGQLPQTGENHTTSLPRADGELFAMLDPQKSQVGFMRYRFPGHYLVQCNYYGVLPPPPHFYALLAYRHLKRYITYIIQLVFNLSTLSSLDIMSTQTLHQCLDGI